MYFTTMLVAVDLNCASTYYSCRMEDSDSLAEGGRQSLHRLKLALADVLSGDTLTLTAPRSTADSPVLVLYSLPSGPGRRRHAALRLRLSLAA
jgi:hypothetical protein